MRNMNSADINTFINKCQGNRGFLTTCNKYIAAGEISRWRGFVGDYLGTEANREDYVFTPRDRAEVYVTLWQVLGYTDYTPLRQSCDVIQASVSGYIVQMLDELEKAPATNERKARQETLFSQYVLSIQNEGEWYNRAMLALDKDNFAQFRRVTRRYRKAIANNRMEPMPNDDNRDYIYTELWKHLDGSTRGFLNRTDVQPRSSYIKLFQTPPTSYEAATGMPEVQPTKITIEIIQEKDTTMNTNIANAVPSVAFSTRHYVYGVDIDNMSENDLINAIKNVEYEITDLTGVKTKSKRIEKKIAELRGMLASIVEQLDKDAPSKKIENL